MLFPYHRAIFQNNTNFIDISKHVANPYSDDYVFPYTNSEDYLYLGSDMPFNHRYFLIDPNYPNAVGAVPSVDIWDGSAWRAAVDVIDTTQVTSGVSLSGSGMIMWQPDRVRQWGFETTSEDISELSSFKIYDMYWARISWSNVFTPTTEIRYIGQSFATDGDLAAYYPDLNDSDVKTAYASGKTDWNEQHIAAAEEIVRHLRSKRVIWSRSQLLDPAIFTIPAVHKAAEIIYRAFGESHERQIAMATKAYATAIAQPAFNVDKDRDGRQDRRERTYSRYSGRR